jgi:hypothetical protein
VEILGNINIESIRTKGFEAGSKAALIETYCRNMACEHTDEIIKEYNRLVESRNGNYINSDLMKMVFPFYANSVENRRLYNLSITNAAAVLTNEAYRRAILRPEVERCIFIVGPYGAGKSYFAQSLFDNDENLMLGNSIVYEGSITPPAFDEKIYYAIEHGVIPEIIVLNPTLELSMRNIRERAMKIGRGVEKKEVVDKFYTIYGYLKGIIQKFSNIPYIIYNRESNISLDFSGGSRNLEDLNHGTYEEVSNEYDRIIAMLENSTENQR